MIAGTSFAQVKLGPTLGVNLANVNYNYSDNAGDPPPNGMRVGLVLGASMDYAISEQFQGKKTEQATSI